VEFLTDAANRIGSLISQGRNPWKESKNDLPALAFLPKGTPPPHPIVIRAADGVVSSGGRLMRLATLV
jgi:hypothetical protein